MPHNIERIHNAFAVLNDIKIMRNDLSNLFSLQQKMQMINFILKQCLKYLIKMDF